MKISSNILYPPARLTWLGVVFASALWLLATAASVQAQTTIGQLAPANPPAYCTTGPFESLPISPTPGASYEVPAPGGVITSWSTNATAGAGQTLEFKLFKPIQAPDTYLVVAHDGPRTIAPSAVNTFKVSIPAQAGELISLNDLNATEVPNACAFRDGTTDSEGSESGNLADGATMTVQAIENGVRPNVTATVQLGPTITGISPASSSVSGGTSVAISGTNFVEVKSVNFGSLPASSYSVSSEGQITATAPPSSAPGPVGVSVTTAVGIATSPQQLTYTACVVPKLTGKKIQTTKKALLKANCKLGKVRGKVSRAARVKTQTPKPGTVRTPGYRVSVKVG
ncbi:MAG TPA: IPT/TIG domain-containing protein [Solirubrobacterales bacterium]|nr:IPT/TIG domain-containing protein [Solirubrobacterales bacterium]